MNTVTKTASMIGAAATVLSLMAAPGFASAHERYYRDQPRYESRYDGYGRYDRCRSDRKRGKATGAVLGALGGALIGHSVSRGDRTPGTLLGAGAGAYVGSQVGKGSRCR